MTITFRLLTALTLIGIAESTTCNEGHKFCLDSSRELNSLVRVKYNGEWFAVCASVWHKDGADTVCMEQHGSDAKSAQSEPVADGISKLAKINWNCIFEGCVTCGNCIELIDRDSCSNMARVDCQDIRLVRKEDDREGMLETYMDYEWGSVCSLTWNMSEADVSCNQLYSCPAKAALAKNKYRGFDVSTHPISARYFICNGHESSLNECVVGPAEDYDTCEDLRRAGVMCRSNCTRPIQPDNVLIHPDREVYAPDEQVTISCAPGYRSESGEAEKMKCYSNCSWAGPEIECKPVCDPPGEVRNATFLPEQHYYYVDTTVTFTCDVGFELEGYRMLTCGEDHRWSHSVPECIDPIKALREKIGADGELGSFPAVVASIVMASAFAIALIFFIILVLRRANEPVDYEDSIENTSQKEEDQEIDEIKELE